MYNKNDDSITGNTEVTISTSCYPRGWKALAITFDPRPIGLSQWFNFLWGWDIWCEGFPLVKILVTINILIWTVTVFIF